MKLNHDMKFRFVVFVTKKYSQPEKNLFILHFFQGIKKKNNTK